MPPEILKPAEVKKDWEETISNAVGELATTHGLELTSWYHDMPIWYIDKIQLGLVRNEGENWLEIHKGDNNHLLLQIDQLGHESLKSVLECLQNTAE